MNKRIIHSYLAGIFFSAVSLCVPARAQVTAAPDNSLPHLTAPHSAALTAPPEKLKPAQSQSPVAPKSADADLKPSNAGKSVNLVFIGDSITEGAGVADPITQATPVGCVHELEKRLPKVTVNFSNEGHGGHTTVDYLPGKADFAKASAAAKELSAAHTGLLVFSIMLGTNDSANTGPRGSPVSALDYHHNLKEIVAQLLADFPDCKVVLHHPIWYSPNTHNHSDYEGDTAANRLKSYFQEIDSIVAEYQTLKPKHVYAGDRFAYDYFARYFKTELNGEFGKNGVFYLHPNWIGAESLGKFWAAAVLNGLRDESMGFQGMR